MQKVLFIFLLIAFAGGNILSWSNGSGVRISLLDVSLIFTVGYFFLSSGKRGDAIRLYLKIFYPFVGIASLSLILQIGRLDLTQIGMSSLYIWRFVVYSLLVVVIAYSKDIKSSVFKGLWFAGLLIGILGFVQYFLYPNLRNLAYLGWDPHLYRVFSSLLDPNFTGIVLVLTILLHSHLSNSLSLFERRTGFLILISSLLLTYSRGSWIAGFTALFMRSLIQKKMMQVIIWLIFFLGFLPLLPRPAGEGVDLMRTLSVYSRIADSQEALRVFAKSPIFGVGFNSLRYIREKTNIVENTEDVSHSGAGFHNSWLFIMATTGIVGLVAYINVWWKIFVLAKEKELLSISAVAVGVHSLFDNSLFFPWVMVWIWVIVGVILRVDKSPSVRS